MSRARIGGRRPWLVLALALLLVLGLAPPGASAGGGRSRATLEVATYNLYLGADLSPLFGVTDAQVLLQRAPAVWAEVEASLPAERMAAVAEVLDRTRPDVVGLQEVALWELAPWTLQPSPAGDVPVATGQYQPVHDFLDLLLDALAARGTPYDVAAVNANFTSAGLPVAVPVTGQHAVRFTDRDVILVRRHATPRVHSADPADGDFAAQFTTQVLGVPLSLDRGWVSVELRVRGRTVRVINTHLEAYGTTELRDEFRNPQAVELAAVAAASPHPTVVLGDINARPTMCRSWRQPPQLADANVVAYRILEEAGLREVWPLVHQDQPCHPASWTSGQDDLFGPDTRTHRIDHIFVDPQLRPRWTTVVGDEAWERSHPSGAWPSDHAASLAALELTHAGRGPGGR